MESCNAGTHEVLSVSSMLFDKELIFMNLLHEELNFKFSLCPTTKKSYRIIYV